MNEPGLTAHCTVDEVYDGDTIEVTLKIRTRVRLLDCWAPEIRTKDKAEKLEGFESRNNLKQLAEGREGVIHLPFGSSVGDSFTFGRMLGRVEVDGVDLSNAQVEGGYATRNKKSK